MVVSSAAQVEGRGTVTDVVLSIIAIGISGAAAYFAWQANQQSKETATAQARSEWERERSRCVSLLRQHRSLLRPAKAETEAFLEVFGQLPADIRAQHQTGRDAVATFDERLGKHAQLIDDFDGRLGNAAGAPITTLIQLAGELEGSLAELDTMVTASRSTIKGCEMRVQAGLPEPAG